MAPRRPADQLEPLRRLAVTRVNEGRKKKEVAAFLGVWHKADSEWVAARRAGGDEAPASNLHRRPKPRLSKLQERSVISHLAKKPQAFG